MANNTDHVTEERCSQLGFGRKAALKQHSIGLVAHHNEYCVDAKPTERVILAFYHSIFDGGHTLRKMLEWAIQS